MKPLKPSKYIFKLNSTYLDMCNYNVLLSLKDVEHNSESIISIGHSQLIKWIEDLTGASDNYLKAEELRKEIKILKQQDSSSENKRVIKQKYDELYNLQFEPNLVSIQFDKKYHFDNCCRSLIINGEPFHRLFGTPGGLKMSTVLFINQKIYQPIYDKITNGRNLSLEYTPAKIEAYHALTASTSNAVSWPNMIVVNGTFTKFKADVIEVRDGIINNDPIVTPIKDKDIEIEINDGCGIMTPEYSRKITMEATGVDEIASGVCARCSFFKGMLYTFPFQEFADDVAHKNTVTDAWGVERSIVGVDVIATTSQLKLWDAYDNYESYRDNCLANGYDFRLTKVSEELDQYRNINYQFDQSFYLDDKDIDELISPTVNEIQDIISLDARKSIVYLAGAGLNDKNVMKSDVAARALMINPELINDPYIRNRIEKMIKKKIRLAKISTIDVEGNFALISADPYAMCEDIFGMEVQGLLGAEEIYHKFWQDKGVNEVLCMRAPMCAHFNIVKQKIKYSDKADYWFRYMQDVMILNSWDTLRIAESGCDQDGDIMMTTNNDVLLNKHRKLPALDCQQKKSSKEIPTEENIAISNKRGFKNRVGSITNLGTAMLNLQSKFDVNSEEWKTLEYRSICIQHFQQCTLDMIKGIKMTPMNPIWNNIRLCLPDKDDTEEALKEKLFNKSVCVNKKPFFFIYRYNATKVEYDKYVKQVDMKLKQKYHISLEELLNNQSLSPELLKEKEYYFNKCPVDMSPGTINKIAWAVMDKFKRFNSLPRVTFDKEIIKSGAIYDMQDYYNVKAVYQDYKSCLVSIAKKINQDEIEEDGGITDKGILDSIFKAKFHEACSNEVELCEILIDLLYDKSNSKGVVWDMCGEVIIQNLLHKNNWTLIYPEVVDNNEEFQCCRKKFVMKQFKIGGEEDGAV